MEKKKITIIRPSNMHGHLRQSTDAAKILPDIIDLAYPYYEYFVAMPNIKPSIKTIEDVLRYKEEIISFVPDEFISAQRFNPIVPLKMIWNNDFKTTPRVITDARKCNYGINCVKLYVIGTTTNADDGVLISDLEKLYPTFATMEELGTLLLIHGEVPDKDVDALDREYIFGDKYLTKIARDFPGLKIVEEHITDERMVKIVEQLPYNVAATITTHHLYMTQNDFLEPGLTARNGCKPYAKLHKDLSAIQQAVRSGNPKFFFGDDTAWHRKENKYCEHSACGCGHTHSIEFVTQFFADADILPHLGNFVSVNGPHFYGLPIPKETLTLEYVETPYSPEAEYKGMLPWGSDRKLFWRIKK